MANIGYFIGEGVRGLRQAKLVTIVSIVTIGIVLFIALAATVALLNVRLLLGNAVEKADVVIYVKDQAAADSAILYELLGSVRLFPQVKSASLVDKDASWKRFAALYGQEILYAVDGNPLPVSIEISLKQEYLKTDEAPLREFITALSALGGVENVRYAREWMAFLVRFSRVFYIAVIIIATIMAATLYITISNSVKLTIYARRELILNMRLVGATPLFIALPFVFEGILQGVTGGFLAAIVFVALKTALGTTALPVTFGPSWMWVTPLVPGIIFGLIGSRAAVRKFLK